MATSRAAAARDAFRVQVDAPGHAVANVQAAVAQLKQTKDINNSTLTTRPLDFLLNMPDVDDNRKQLFN